MHLNTCSLYFVKRAVTDDTAMHMRVSDLSLWWDHIVGLDLVSRYGVKTRAPLMEDWDLVAGVTDPSGVLWRIAEVRASNRD